MRGRRLLEGHSEQAFSAIDAGWHQRRDRFGAKHLGTAGEPRRTGGHERDGRVDRRVRRVGGGSGASAAASGASPSSASKGATPGSGSTTGRASAARAAGSTSPTGTSRAGRRARQRTYQRSFFDRYRSLIVGGGIVAGLLLFGAFVFLGSTGTTYACGSQVDPVSPAPVTPPATPQLGQVIPDMGRSHITPGTKAEYLYCPPASGPHYNIAGRGPIPPRFYGPDTGTEPQGWIHNLEHGGFAILYNCSQPGSCTQAGARRAQSARLELPGQPDLQHPGRRDQSRHRALRHDEDEVRRRRLEPRAAHRRARHPADARVLGAGRRAEQPGAAVRDAHREPGRQRRSIAGAQCVGIAGRFGRKPRGLGRELPGSVGCQPGGVGREPGIERGAFGQPGLELIEPQPL